MTRLIIILIAFSICKPGLTQQGGLNITYSRDIDFGYIIPGTNKTVTEVFTEAGKFTITGNETGMTVSVSLNLPSHLTGASGNIPVIYTATQSTNSNDYQPGEPFNPYTGTTLKFDETASEHFIRIGGTITPALTQPPGQYSAPLIITLTVISN